MADDDRSKREITIYECKNCHAVLGNSDFLVKEYGDAKFIYISEIENAILTTTLKVVVSGNDKGCKYRIVQCQQCREDVGILYVAVTDELKRLQNVYKIIIAKIISVKTMINSGPTAQNNAAILAQLADHKSKFEDVAVMLVEALRDRSLIKDSILMHAECLRMLKQEIDELKGQDPGTESS